MALMRVAFYGGSFDPPHVGHLLSAVYALALGFDKVLVVPVYQHAFGKRMAPFDVRVALCRACFRGIGGVEVSELEASLERPNYSVRTLERLAGEHPEWQLRTLVGSDVLAETHAWHEFDRVEKLAPLFVIPRLGHEVNGLGPAVLPEVSSSEVRELLQRRGGEGVDEERLRRLVPAHVLETIDAENLYRATP
jgi:nicotinate-nucleotide adenylyltransferase